MGRCILICRRCHVLNNQMLMNHFLFGSKRRKKSIRVLFDITPIVHKAHDSRTHTYTHTHFLRLGLLVDVTPRHPSPPLCLICLSRHLSLSGLPSLRAAVAVIFHCGEQAGAVNTPLLTPRTLGDPRNPCVSDASPKVSHSKAPVLQRCVCSSDPVIHRPARSPARSY